MSWYHRKHHLPKSTNQSINHCRTHTLTTVSPTHLISHHPINHCLTHPPYFLIHFFTHSRALANPPPPFFFFTQMYNSLNTDLLMWFPFAVSVCTQKFKSLIWRLSWWRIGWVMKRIVHIQDTVIWWNSTSDVSSSIKGNITERESLLKIIKFLVKMREMWV